MEGFTNEEKKLLEKIRKSEKFGDTALDLANLSDLMTPDLSTQFKGSRWFEKYSKNPDSRHAIDDNVRTKYLNYDAEGSGLTIHTRGGVINGLSLTSAEDVPEIPALTNWRVQWMPRSLYLFHKVMYLTSKKEIKT